MVLYDGKVHARINIFSGSGGGGPRGTVFAGGIEGVVLVIFLC